MQATSDKTASANFTQTGGTANNARGIAGNVTNGKTGYAPFYQWGRKDAFRSSQYTTAPAANTTLIYSRTSVTVGMTIQNPTTHYDNKGNDGGTAYTPIYYNAWNATYTTYAGESTDKIDGLEKTVKTIYDPCPVGYTVPPANTFIAFTTGNMLVDGNGREYTSNDKALYFPYFGRRYYVSAELYNVGTLGDYWLSVCGLETTGRFLYFDNSNVIPSDISGSGNSRASGESIRPVREN